MTQVRAQNAAGLAKTDEPAVLLIGFADPRPKSFGATIIVNSSTRGSIKTRQWTAIEVPPGQINVELKFSGWSSHKAQTLALTCGPREKRFLLYASEPKLLDPVPMPGGGTFVVATTQGSFFEIPAEVGKKLFLRFDFVAPFSANTAKK